MARPSELFGSGPDRTPAEARPPSVVGRAGGGGRVVHPHVVRALSAAVHDGIIEDRNTTPPAFNCKPWLSPPELFSRSMETVMGAAPELDIWL